MISLAARRPAVRAVVICAYVLAVELARALFMNVPYGTMPALLLGGAALAVTAIAFPLERLGLSRKRLGLRVIGGLALGAVLLLPTAVRSGAPLMPAELAAAAIAVSIGEEVAFRGAVFVALEDLGGAPLAVFGSTVLWTLAHALSHPPAFLFAVAAAGLLLGLWRWAGKDLVGPVIAHVIADVAL